MSVWVLCTIYIYINREYENIFFISYVFANLMPKLTNFTTIIRLISIKKLLLFKLEKVIAIL